MQGLLFVEVVTQRLKTSLQNKSHILIKSQSLSTLKLFDYHPSKHYRWLENQLNRKAIQWYWSMNIAIIALIVIIKR
jgi:hypothetical protein